MRYVLLLLLAPASCGGPGDYERARDQYERANWYYKQGDHEAAAPLYEYVVRYRDSIRDAHLRLADCYDKTSRPDNAVHVLKRMLRLLDPNDSDALRQLAGVYSRRGWKKEAVETYKKLLEQNPADADEIRKAVERLEQGEK